jgi:hypothetical protein
VLRVRLLKSSTNIATSYILLIYFYEFSQHDHSDLLLIIAFNVLLNYFERSLQEAICLCLLLQTNSFDFSSEVALGKS